MQETEHLSVGIEAIDSRHKELFIRSNSLADAIRQGKWKHIVNRVITFIENMLHHISALKKRSCSIMPTLTRTAACHVSQLPL
jgi:hemerythrin